MRICEKHGWTYAQWQALSEQEQIDRLAYQHQRDEFLDALIHSFSERIANEKVVELPAYVMAIIQRYAA